MRVLSMLLLAASIVGLATGLSMCGQMEVVEAASKTARDSLYLVPSGVVLGLAVVRMPALPVLAASHIRRPPPAAPRPPHPVRLPAVR